MNDLLDVVFINSGKGIVNTKSIFLRRFGL